MCREILRPLPPAQLCVLVLAAWRKEQRLQFWDFWMGFFSLSSDRAFKRSQGEGGGPAHPHLQIPSALALGSR